MGIVLREYPRIVHEKRFLSESEVQNLLNLAEGKFVRSTVVDNDTGESVVNEYRTGEYAMIGASPDAGTKAIEERLAAVTTTRALQGEPIQVIKYGVGDNYKPHFDWFDPALPGSQKQLLQGGQRIYTAIMCLKEAEEGGETEFVEVSPSIKVKLESGDVLFFQNLDPHGKPEKLAKHAGLPVVAGTKIIATRWIRERAFDGSEESEALKTKASNQSKLDEARAAAQKAQAELAKATEEEGGIRAKLCFDEILVVLKKHNCVLIATPGIEINPQGGLRAYATADVQPRPIPQVKQQ